MWQLFIRSQKIRVMRHRPRAGFVNLTHIGLVMMQNYLLPGRVINKLCISNTNLNKSHSLSTNISMVKNDIYHEQYSDS
jgi:hypothetical protein